MTSLEVFPARWARWNRRRRAHSEWPVVSRWSPPSVAQLWPGEHPMFDSDQPLSNPSGGEHQGLRVGHVGASRAPRPQARPGHQGGQPPRHPDGPERDFTLVSDLSTHRIA